LPLLTRLNVPHLTTFHNRLDTPDLPAVLARFPDAPLVSISDHHRKPVPSANWLGTVYHGMPANTFAPSYEPGSYLAFVGRLTKEKSPETAIALARQSGIALRIAAKIPRSETRYYKDKLEPLIDGDRIRLVGELNDADKACLLRNASALLFPIDWPEPFGLVMIEAMACGTPVIAFRRGSVPEVIDDGVTGLSPMTMLRHWRRSDASMSSTAGAFEQPSTSALPRNGWRETISVIMRRCSLSQVLRSESDGTKRHCAG
jgi:glycosyltransferase involved in cell wall biosynthesis